MSDTIKIDNDYKVVGKLTLRGIAEMTPEQRQEIVDWLSSQLESVVNDPESFAKVFTATFYRR